VQFFLRNQALGSPRTVTLQGPIADARNPSTFGQPIPLSTDEKEGLTFSYSGWLLVEDWMYRQGSLRCIFNKGGAGAKQSAPGLFLDATSNTLLLKLDTFGDQETVQIPNLPARKWIHFAIVVDQNAVDIYIDGVLRTHHSLRQLPRQNKGPVAIAPEGGWAGQIGTLTYHRYALSPPEITAMVATPPYEDTSKSRVPLPPYLDSSWYLGRY
jgi:hypothetical protein